MPLAPAVWIRSIVAIVVSCCAIACGGDASGDSVTIPVEVAVAANFLPVAESVVAHLEREGGVAVRLSAGSSGALYTQIRQGAPFEVFLSADTERPMRLEDDGLAVPGSRRAYALGRLVAFGPRLAEAWELPGVLSMGGVRVAWANPRTAPYGAAAREVLEAWGLADLEGAVGESVGQTYQFAASGAADLAFVSRSQVLDAAPATVREVPADLYRPIVQEAVLIGPGEPRPEARAFLDALGSEWARGLIAAGGYEVPGGL